MPTDKPDRKIDRTPQNDLRKAIDLIENATKKVVPLRNKELSDALYELARRTQAIIGDIDKAAPAVSP